MCESGLLGLTTLYNTGKWTDIYTSGGADTLRRHSRKSPQYRYSIATLRVLLSIS